MDRWKLSERTMEFIRKYRYVLLVLLLGLILMCLPDGKKASDDPVLSAEDDIGETMEMRLEIILSQIRGAGKVKVLLTEARGQRTVYQTDPGSDGTSADTVLVSGSERAQQGLVSQVVAPVFQGAVVVCQGGDDPAVRLAIVEAVCDVTGLGADRVTVLKMK